MMLLMSRVPMMMWQVSKTLNNLSAVVKGDQKPSAEGGPEEEQQAQPRITRFLAKHSFAGPEQIESLLENLALDVRPDDQGLLRYARVTYVYHHVPCVCGHVTSINDDLHTETQVRLHVSAVRHAHGAVHNALGPDPRSDRRLSPHRRGRRRGNHADGFARYCVVGARR